MNQPLRVFIGHDRREGEAFSVAQRTAEHFGCVVIPLYEDRLRASGLMVRTTDRRDRTYDFNSAALQSTDFAIARFFVPLLSHSGWSLFVDCDVVFMEDPHELLRYADESKAVCCVKFGELKMPDTKMDGQAQQPYPRKLWSSVALWNSDHPANRRLNLITLNQWAGRDLHAFSWLADGEIGELPAEANWLVGVQPKPPRPMIAHFTLGTPNMVGRETTEHSHLWWEAKAAGTR